SQESAKRGVWYGIVAMIIAVLATVFGPNRKGGYIFILSAIALASVFGIALARRVEMTSMPQLVAILHSFVGLAAVLVGFGSYLDQTAIDHAVDSEAAVKHIIPLIEVYLGVFIGAITFTGSIVAWGKLEG